MFDAAKQLGRQGLWVVAVVNPHAGPLGRWAVRTHSVSLLNQLPSAYYTCACVYYVLLPTVSGALDRLCFQIAVQNWSRMTAVTNWYVLLPQIHAEIANEMDPHIQPNLIPLLSTILPCPEHHPESIHCQGCGREPTTVPISVSLLTSNLPCFLNPQPRLPCLVSVACSTSNLPCFLNPSTSPSLSSQRGLSAPPISTPCSSSHQTLILACR
jgi:hypothetical protein